MMNLNDAFKLKCDVMRKSGPVDTERVVFRCGAEQFFTLRAESTKGEVYLTSSGEFYMFGHRILIDYVGSHAPLTCEVIE